jgi:tRNA U34 5-methylaminomethyl-2-thiouridine-forming methyltransferase MnmC
MHESKAFQIENFHFTLIEGDILDFPEHLTWPVSNNLQGLNSHHPKTLEVSKDLQGLNSDDDETLEVSKNLQGLRENTHRLNDILYNVVYFDAFAPNFQPEMWTVDMFRFLKEKMQPNGIIVTYCAQGQFQRTLKSLGFHVEILPGPPGKREMVRGRNE